MKAIYCESFSPDGSGLSLREVERPSPKSGEVLVKVECSSVHPADVMMIGGTYSRGAELPFRVGLTGVGRVVERRGGGLAARLIAGRRVVFALPEGRFGTWAEYATTQPSLCFPLADALPSSAAVNLLSNGASAIGLAQRVRELNGKGAVVTAAAGDLGRLVRAALHQRGRSVLAIVRREGQAAQLRDAGERHVLASESPSFGDELARIARALELRTAVDMVAGTMPSRLLTALPPGSTVIAVGRLAGAPIEVDAMEPLIARGGRIEGFNVGHWFDGKPLPAAVLALMRAQRLLLASPSPPPLRRFGLGELVARFAEALGSTTGGKTLVEVGGPSRERS